MAVKESTSPLVAAVAAAVFCLLLFLPARQYGFVSFDDPDYVLNNPVIRSLSGGGLGAMFSQAHLGWWMPLTWLSLAVDYHFWQLDPFGYHLTNVLLHAVNVGLVVLIIHAVCRDREMTGGGYRYPALLFVAGLFFGAHPLRVESVAWVTERKDVLNGLFTFSSILFYLRYVRHKEQLHGHWQKWFGLSLVCFACSLMAKSVSVVMPAILVVLDVSPLGRLRTKTLWQLCLEKWPFWGASAAMIFATLLFAAQSQYLVTYEAFPFSQRLAVSANAIWEYARMLLFPLQLSPFYVIPDPIPASYWFKGFFAVLAVTGACLAWKKLPWVTACVLCFSLPLLPVLAFFQNGDQAYADRFTYLPSLFPALFLTLSLAVTAKSEQQSGRNRALAAIVVAVTIVFTLATICQLTVWKSAETFLNRVVEVEPLAITYKERGRYYQAVGRYADAVADYSAALRMIPPTLEPFAYNFYALRGESFREGGRLEDAVGDFTQAITLHPHPAYYYHRGLALEALRRDAEAKDDFRRAGAETGPIVWID